MRRQLHVEKWVRGVYSLWRFVHNSQVELTSERKATFLAELARHGIVVRAARAASPHSARGCVMSFRDERGRDPEFASDWDEAMEQARGQVESELHRRAVEGYEEPVYQRGEKVGTVRKYSDRLLELRFKSLIPAYRPEHRECRGDVRDPPRAVTNSAAPLSNSLRGSRSPR